MIGTDSDNYSFHHKNRSNTSYKQIKYCLALILLSAVSACSGEPPHNSSPSVSQIIDMTAIEANGLMQEQDVVVLDIRTPEEYNAGHIQNAILIDYYDDSFKEKLSQLDRNATYLVHCKSGGRSGRSLKIFKQLGFKHVAHLERGFDGWKRAGMPVVES